MRVLYLHGTYVPPPTDPRQDRFGWLSAVLEGDVLQAIWFQRPEDVEATFGTGSYPIYTRGRFRYRFLPASGRGTRVEKLQLAWFFLSEGLRIHRECGFDCVIAYSHTLTAICGVILKWLTGSKLIIEIVTAPDTIYVCNSGHPGFRERIKQLYSEISLHLTLWCCDRVHLLAAPLIAGYKWLQKVPASVFFEAVPVSQIPRHVEEAQRYVLLVGAPWRVKGVDLLIRAFRGLAAEFPDVRLKLLGYYPDREHLDRLVQGSPQIEILKPRANPVVLEIISKATVLALPSRSEGMGRVILEAMAAGVPVVASHVGGIPSLVRDGENGLLVPAEDVDALEAALRRLLTDPALRKRMGARGYELAHTEFSEEAYVEQFARMVEATVGRGRDAESNQLRHGVTV